MHYFLFAKKITFSYNIKLKERRYCMKFILDEQDLITKAKSFQSIYNSNKKDFWYNFTLNDILADTISKKFKLDKNLVLDDVKKFSNNYKSLIVSFINDEASYQGKYWTFEEVYAYVESWQIEKYGKWKMFCKVLAEFDKLEFLMKERSISPQKIKEQKNQLIGIIQSIGLYL